MAITFSNTGKIGLWECDFENCGEWTADINHTTPPGGYGIGVSNNNADGSGHWSKITASAGRTGLGWRQFMAGGVNMNSAGVNAPFTAQSEIWMRMYVRFDASVSWDPAYNGGVPQYKKMMYVNQGRSPYNCLDIIGDHWTITNTQLYQSGNGSGWTSKFSDRGWHCVEFYIKRTGGIYRIWVDGILVYEITGVTTITIDIDHLFFLSNQRTIASGTYGWVDIDDLAIAIPSYTGWQYDGKGNRMIGSTGVTPLVQILQPPKNLRIVLGGN